MKKIVLISLIAFFAFACSSSDNYEVIGSTQESDEGNQESNGYNLLFIGKPLISKKNTVKCIIWYQESFCYCHMYLLHKASSIL